MSTYDRFTTLSGVSGQRGGRAPRSRPAFQKFWPRLRWVYLIFGFVLMGLFGGGLAPQAAAAGNTYYVSSIDPNAADDNPGTEALPWKTMAKVNAEMANFGPGDQILFERGSLFKGPLTVDDVDGSQGSPITFGAYGDGPAPVISDLTSLTGWRATGDNKWQTTCSACQVQPNKLLLDGRTQPLARWPNLDEADKGYLYYESFSGKTSITDNDLPGGINWTGGEVVLRTVAWVLDRLPIQSHTGNTLTFSENATYDIKAGYGYFIQNHPAALDRDGEWVYDPATGKITLYFAGGDLNSRLVQVTTVEKLGDILNADYLTIRDIEWRGGNEAGLFMSNCQSVVLENLKVIDSGAEGIRLGNCSDTTIAHSEIQEALNQGLRIYNCDNCHVHHNLINNIATFAGMGKNGNVHHSGVIFNGGNSIMEYNRVTNVGYLGIRVEGDVVIRYNYVAHFNLIKIDGGGIYCWRNTGSKIIGNIILYGIGDKAAVPWGIEATHGIYLDDASQDIEIRDNTIAFMSTSGIFLHNTTNITIVDNTIYGVKEHQMLYADDDSGHDVDNNDIRGNLFFMGQAGAKAAIFSSLDGDSFFDNLGTINDNTFCNPFYENILTRRYYPGGVKDEQDLTLSQWRHWSGQDANSQACSFHYPTHQVEQEVSADLVTNGTFDSNVDDWYGWPGSSFEKSWDTGQLNGGSLKAAHTGSDKTIYVFHDVGSIEAGKIYRLRFTTTSDQPHRAIKALLQKKATSEYLAQALLLALEDKPHTYELYFTATASAPDGRLAFILRREDKAVWLDDVALHEVEATAIELDDVVSFSYNASESPKTVDLGGYTYTDLQGKTYPAWSAVTVEPYASLILMRSLEPTSFRPVYLPAVIRQLSK